MDLRSAGGDEDDELRAGTRFLELPAVPLRVSNEDDGWFSCRRQAREAREVSPLDVAAVVHLRGPNSLRRSPSLIVFAALDCWRRPLDGRSKAIPNRFRLGHRADSACTTASRLRWTNFLASAPMKLFPDLW